MDKFGGTSTIDASIMVFGLLKFCVSTIDGAFFKIITFYVIGRDNLGDARFCVSTVGGVSFMILCLVVEAPVGGRCAGDGLEDAVEGGLAGETR